MNKTLIHTITLLAISCGLIAETKTAITEDGETVILYQDGTWKTKEKIESNESKTSHFRKVRWGDSIEKVKESEDLELKHDESDIIGYQTEVAGLETLLAYIFVQNKLVRSKYIVTERHTNANDFITSVQLKVVESQLFRNQQMLLTSRIIRKQLIERDFLKNVHAQNLQYT